MDKGIFAGREMLLAVTGKGENVSTELCNRGSRRLMWVSAEGSPVRTRVPEPAVTVFETDSFTAAGKGYTSVAQLTQTETGGVYTDCHGRTVISLSERFPCFDSYDYLYENRYYRWWLIIQPESITRVYAEDGRGKIYVTEDVLDLEPVCVEALKNAGLVIREEK